MVAFLKAHSHDVHLTHAGEAGVCVAAQIENFLILCTTPVCRIHTHQTHVMQAPAVEHILTILVSVHKPIVRDRLKFKNRLVKRSK